MEKKLFRVKKNQLKMMARRGYDISKESEILKEDAKNFIQKYHKVAKEQEIDFRNALSKLYTHTKENKKCLVYFAKPTHETKQLGKAVVVDFVEQFTKYECKEAILISELPLSVKGSSDLEGITEPFIQIFDDNELITNIVDHVFVPEHELINCNQLGQLGLKKFELPKISINDPVIKQYGWRSGNVVKITRDIFFDVVVRKSIFYRLISD